ncbi:pro-sigmaK processing inhibitor BofA family protein [Clostridium sp. JN-9]|uniref:pro-sigmaK processing inhibitor BofA family protein n=1 Tax=Clostridium sp. JN-9 TaxID=2507159 RepID=UPI000FFDF8FE|nr:pro-sigmaK processing inhibitor BofA family protein [Clostridium sp. JN-9]QAT38835.1 pro-sigmaK processing inhibitor BofA [Clostridium sp. JN-9]
MSQYIGYFLLAIIALFLFGKLFALSIKFIIKLILNGVLGVVLLFVVNFIGAYFSFSIGINVWTALIAGFFGIPGVIFLIIFKLFL